MAFDLDPNINARAAELAEGKCGPHDRFFCQLPDGELTYTLTLADGERVTREAQPGSKRNLQSGETVPSPVIVEVTDIVREIAARI